MADIRAIVFVTNAISAGLALKALESDAVPLGETALVLGRHMAMPRAGEFGAVIDYGVPASLTLAGQYRTIGYYRDASRRIAQWLASGRVEHLYIANIDNLLTNHMLQWLRRGGRAKLTVVAEGLMNYQEIDLDDRAAWRWKVKPLIAPFLGLDYRTPARHLSGAFEPECDRVISFASRGLKAPPEKVKVFPLPAVPPPANVDPEKALVILTGISQWMKPEEFETFADAFGRWFSTLGARSVVIKPHPYYPSGGIEKRLPAYSILNDSRSLEQLAPEIDAGLIVGYCSTGLVTLKLMRPDLRCIDFGSDFYCRTAYHGDYSVVEFLTGSGVEIIIAGEKGSKY